MNKENNLEKTFSKNSLITVSKKAGIKCISQCGIEKIRNILMNKIKTLSERLCDFYSIKNGKTINKKVIIDFLESEGIHMICSVKE